MGGVRSQPDDELNGETASGGLRISGRHVSVAILGVVIVAVASRWLDSEQPIFAALKLLTATLAIGVVPGAVATMWWRPRPSLTLLELAGLGIAVSFGLVQLITIAAVTLHFNAFLAATLLIVASAGAAARHMVRPAPVIVLAVDELIVVGLLGVVAIALYNLGSPVEWFEDQVHVAIVRRLAELPSPRLDNLYFTPGVVYTYPFPGTHYFMALVAQLGAIDPLFTYHKLRFFWGPAAIVLLYLAARAIFGGRGVAAAVAMTAITLVLTGAFAAVPGFRSGWGQLIPYSHASDVAMTVLMPALLVAGFGYVLAATSRERGYFLGATVMLIAMLTIVHIREVVQFAAYMGCLLVVALARREFSPLRRPAAMLLALTMAIAGVYALWHGQAVTLVGTVVGDQRARLEAIAHASTWRDLLLTPASTVLNEFVLNADQIYEGTTPLFLWAGPAVLLLFRRQPLTWMVCVATAVYLAVMTLPVLAIPYIYLTYFEILFTPVRNVIFFVYLFAGAIIYAAVFALARWDRTRMSAPVAGAAAGALALAAMLCLNQTTRGFILPLIAAYLLAVIVVWQPSVRWPMARTIVVAMLLILGLAALRPQRDPAPRVAEVSVRWSTDLADDRRQLLEQQFTLTSGEPNSNRSAAVNVWNYALQNASQENVRALVSHPAVVDTAGIDRSTFIVLLRPPPNDDPYLGVLYVPAMQYPGGNWFVAAAVFLWALGFVAPAMLASARGERFIEALNARIDTPLYRQVIPFALVLVPFALWSARPTLSPLHRPEPGAASTPSSMLAAMPCITTERRPAPFSEDLLEGEAVMLPERTTCPPDRGVIQWIQQNVPVESVFAIDRWNPVSADRVHGRTGGRLPAG